VIDQRGLVQTLARRRQNVMINELGQNALDDSVTFRSA
jgi:hypothetical protein